MSKKIYIQILITGVILLIIFFVYLVYFKNIDNKLVENEVKSSAKNLLESSDDLIKEMLKQRKLNRNFNDKKFDAIETERLEEIE